MKFSDSLIAAVARTLQIAIISGTDIVDHLRTFEVEDSDGSLKLTEESQKRIEKEIEGMLAIIETDRSQQAQQQETE
jgi:peptidoglycan hydrolase CwlO-like protein